MKIKKILLSLIDYPDHVISKFLRERERERRGIDTERERERKRGRGRDKEGEREWNRETVRERE